MIRNIKVIHKSKVSIYKIYTFVAIALLTSSSLASMDFLAIGEAFLGGFFTAQKEPNLLQDKEMIRIKRRSESKNLLFHTFIDIRLYVNVFNANMKVPFETVQVVLSRNHPISLFLIFLSKDFYNIPTEQPI